MEIRSILINVDIGSPHSTSLDYAIDLAHRFDAQLIGVGADQPNLAYLGGGNGAVAVDIYAAEHEAIERQLKQAQEVFEATVPAAIAHRWYAYTALPTQALLASARMVDILVTPSTITNTVGAIQSVNLGELVLGSGRPVINVASSDTKATFDKIVIGWKDTREARRAVSDALPFLTRAKEVLAVSISEGEFAEERRSLDDLAAWLATHGVSAKTDILNDPEGLGDLLSVRALSEAADLLVTGAYGHTRMREWLFGGTTRNVLGTNQLNRFLSN